MADLVKKVGILQRGRPGKPGNAHEWFQKMERVLRALSLYHVVEPKDDRELRKLEYLKASIGEGKDGKAKVAKINYERLIAEDKVIAILMATVEKDLASSIIGRTAAEAWKSLRPVHMINVMLHVWQQMQEMKVKDYECVVDYVAKMRDNNADSTRPREGEASLPRTYDRDYCSWADSITTPMDRVGRRLLHREDGPHSRRRVWHGRLGKGSPKKRRGTWG